MQSILLRPSGIIISNKGNEKETRGVLMEKKIQRQQHNQKRLTNAFNHRAALSRLTRYLAGEKFLRNPFEWQSDARFKFLSSMAFLLHLEDVLFGIR